MESSLKLKQNQFEKLAESLEIRKDQITNIDIKINIFEKNNIDNSDYANLIVLSDNYFSDQFIINNNMKLKKGDSLIFSSKDVKIKTVNNKVYIFISKSFKDEIEIKDIKANLSNYKKFNFSLSKIIDTREQIMINENNYISIKLKAEFIEKNGQNIFKFKDIFGKEVEIENYSTFKSEIEGQKIYNFDYVYCTEDEKVKIIHNSSITKLEYEDNIFMESYRIKGLFDIKEIITLKGKIISFDLCKKTVIIKDEQNIERNIVLNFNLMKKIELNCICKFCNFVKINDYNNEYKYTNFSNIIPTQITSINFKLINNSQDYYNIIKIDGKSLKIENKKNNIFIINTTNHDKNIMEKEIILEKYNDIDTKILERSISYILEVNKGKTNNFHIYMGKNGSKSLQIYSQSLNANLIPKSYCLKINKEDEVFNEFDSFENELKNRITFINIPDDLENKLTDFKLEKIYENINSGKTLKYLHLYGEKEKILEFNIFKNESEKEEISKINNILNSLPLDDISLFYEKYSHNNDNLNYFISKKLYMNSKNEFNKLFANDFTELNKKIKNIFKYFNKNNKNEQMDYLLIKKLCFFSLIINNYELDYLINLISNFMILILKINEYEFIDKIRIITAYINQINDQKIFCDLNLIKLDDENNKSYIFCKNAFDKFLSIINNLKEDMPFFQLIHQFNSIIRMENNYKENMYSGSILNVDDVKLDIFKNLNNYLFISTEINSLDSAIWINSKVLVVYYFRIYNGQKRLSNLSIEEKKRLESAFLFIYFHEYTGHLKTNINNYLSSPTTAYLNNLEVKKFVFEENDSGFILENILNDDDIKISQFYKNELSPKLLDIKLYLQKDFKDLKSVLNDIYKNKEESLKEGKKFIDSKKYKNEILKDIDNNFEFMSYRELFHIFSNLEGEEKEKAKKTRAYKYFKEIASNREKLK